MTLTAGKTRTCVQLWRESSARVHSCTRLYEPSFLKNYASFTQGTSDAKPLVKNALALSTTQLPEAALARGAQGRVPLREARPRPGQRYDGLHWAAGGTDTLGCMRGSACLDSPKSLFCCDMHVFGGIVLCTRGKLGLCFCSSARYAVMVETMVTY